MIKPQSESFVELVNILNDGAYHNGEVIGEMLQLTRSAVWKMIKKLEKHGVIIHSAKGKGYALAEPLILLQKNSIKPLLKNADVDLTLLESVDSTNTYLSQSVGETIQICLAEEQTAGRGRLNREWYSPFGANLYFSCRYPFKREVSELSGLSLVIGLAIVQALKNMNMDARFQVKWPNDIVFEQKKVAGILIELKAETHSHCRVVIGVGMNVNMMHDKAAISQPWISLRQIFNQYIDRNRLSALITNELLTYLAKFEQHGFAAFIAEWKANDVLLAQKVALKTAQGKLTGVGGGVNEQGHLLLELSNGCTRAFSSGDTTLLKANAG